MTDPSAEPDPKAEPRSDREIAEELRLRPPPPPVTRLSRKVLIGLGATGSVALAAMLIFALQSRDKDEPPPDLYNTERVTPADGLGALPRDYAGLPRSAPPLGPPLPGDLGKPMLRAQQEGPGAMPPVQPGQIQPPVDPARQRAADAREAARTSALFAPSQLAATSPIENAGSAAIEPGDASSPEIAKGQPRFREQPVDRRTVSAERITEPPSPNVLQAGSVIPAALITGLRSDLPGQVTAQVTSAVFDSPTGTRLLIPQGARLIGEYDAEIGFGQERLMLVWTRLIFPDGRSLVLERLPGADAQGFAGLQDRVDHHWDRVARAGLVSTVLGIGAELGAGDDDNLVRALRRGAQDSFNQAGQQIVQRELTIRPTITIRPGHTMRVLVTRDLIIEPAGAKE
jgi:type IV secretion system protein VirB10